MILSSVGPVICTSLSLAPGFTETQKQGQILVHHKGILATTLDATCISQGTKQKARILTMQWQQKANRVFFKQNRVVGIGSSKQIGR